MRFKPYRFLLLLLLMATAAEAETQVNVVGLFTGKAVVIINHGQPKTLSVGQVTSEGVKLISADSSQAVFEIDGKRHALGMGQAANIAGSAGGENGSAILYADAAGHYFTRGQINGASLNFLVDTGATALSLNSGDAQAAGIDYKKGQRIVMQSATGVVNAYHVVVNTLKVGSIIMNQIDAVVVDGSSPPCVLLGMTALNRMDMKRDGMTLTLSKKY